MSRIQAASSAADDLFQVVIDDLDTTRGGIGWMTEQIGWKYSALIGEYLLSSVQGVKKSLAESELSIAQYSSLEHSQNTKLAKAEQALPTKDGLVPDDMRTVLESPNEQLMDIFHDHALVALSQALDRISAVVVATCGAKTNLTQVNWSELAAFAESAAKNNPTYLKIQPGRLMPPGSLGRDLQNSILSTILEWPSFGPRDWLPWMLRYRNTAVHRAPHLSWTIATKGPFKKTGQRHIRPQVRQPGWAELESMYRSARKDINELLLLQSPTVVLTGLADSTAKYCESILSKSKELWFKRRETPEIIIQSAGMWPSRRNADLLNFPGYGESRKVDGDQLAVNPIQVTRMKAAQLFDLSLWSEE